MTDFTMNPIAAETRKRRVRVRRQFLEGVTPSEEDRALLLRDAFAAALIAQGLESVSFTIESSSSYQDDVDEAVRDAETFEDLVETLSGMAELLSRIIGLDRGADADEKVTSGQS